MHSCRFIFFSIEHDFYNHISQTIPGNLADITLVRVHPAILAPAITQETATEIRGILRNADGSSAFFKGNLTQLIGQDIDANAPGYVII